MREAGGGKWGPSPGNPLEGRGKEKKGRRGERYEKKTSHLGRKKGGEKVSSFIVHPNVKTGGRGPCPSVEPPPAQGGGGGGGGGGETPARSFFGVMVAWKGKEKKRGEKRLEDPLVLSNITQEERRRKEVMTSLVVTFGALEVGHYKREERGGGKE